MKLLYPAFAAFAHLVFFSFMLALFGWLLGDPPSYADITFVLAFSAVARTYQNERDIVQRGRRP